MAKRQYYKKLAAHQDLLVLLAVLTLLLLALLKPSVPVKHDIHSYFFIVDITQSMNAVDMQVNGKPASRLDHTKQLLRETISSLPCDTKVGLGMFSGVNIVTLYLPIEVCSNFSAIQDTLDHIDWRNAWTADSRVRESMLSTSRVVSNFPEPAQVVFFSDGEEAPKLHAFNTRDLSTLQNADGWLLVGIGSEKGAAIPKFTEKNQLLGYWSHESMQLAPGAAPIAAAGLLNRKKDIAEDINDRYLSKLSEATMQAMAKEIGATYVRGDTYMTLQSAMKKQKPARREWAPWSLSSALAGLAGLFLLLAYVPFSRFVKKDIASKQPPAFISAQL